MSAADDLRLIAQLRLTAPHSDDGYMLLRAANAIEDANARVALAQADALNAAADAWTEHLKKVSSSRTAPLPTVVWLRDRAMLVEMGRA